MAIQSAHPVAPTAGAERDQQGAGKDVGAGIVERLRQMYCGLHGHDNLMHFEKQRMYLRCSSCGHESPGWMLKEAEPKVMSRGDVRHQAGARPHLVRARRIA